LVSLRFPPPFPPEAVFQGERVIVLAFFFYGTGPSFFLLSGKEKVGSTPLSLFPVLPPLSFFSPEKKEGERFLPFPSLPSPFSLS